MTETTRKIDEWRAQGSPQEIEVGICLNRELLTEFDRLMRAHDAEMERRKQRRKLLGEAGGMMKGEDKADDDIARRLAECYEAIKADEEEHVFRFRKMDYHVYRKMMEEHPATDEQKRLNPYARYDDDVVEPMLVACSCVDPKMEPADAEALRNDLPIEPWDRLVKGAAQANGGPDLPKEVRSIVDRLSSELRSTSPAEPASPSRSSADGS